jgi:hypothetical protein
LLFKPLENAIKKWPLWMLDFEWSSMSHIRHNPSRNIIPGYINP